MTPLTGALLCHISDHSTFIRPLSADGIRGVCATCCQLGEGMGLAQAFAVAESKAENRIASNRAVLILGKQGSTHSEVGVTPANPRLNETFSQRLTEIAIASHLPGHPQD